MILCQKFDSPKLLASFELIKPWVNFSLREFSRGILSQGELFRGKLFPPFISTQFLNHMLSLAD